MTTNDCEGTEMEGFEHLVHARAPCLDCHHASFLVDNNHFLLDSIEHLGRVDQDMNRMSNPNGISLHFRSLYCRKNCAQRQQEMAEDAPTTDLDCHNHNCNLVADMCEVD